MTTRGCETEMTAQRMLRVMVCGAMERMCEADGICLMSVRGRLVDIGRSLVPSGSEISVVVDRIEVSDANEKVVVVLRRLVSSMVSAGAICDETKPSSRAMECSRKSCLVAMSKSGIWALKEKNCVCGTP